MVEKEEERSDRIDVSSRSSKRERSGDRVTISAETVKAERPERRLPRFQLRESRDDRTCYTNVTRVSKHWSSFSQIHVS